MFQGENHRQIGERLVVPRVAVIVAFAAVGICFWVLQLVRHSFTISIPREHSKDLQMGRETRDGRQDRNRPA